MGCGLGTAGLTYSFVDGGASYDEKYYIHDYDFDNSGVNDLVETITVLNSSEATILYHSQKMKNWYTRKLCGLVFFIRSHS